MNKFKNYIHSLSSAKTALIAGFLLVLGWSPLPTFPLLFLGIFLLVILESKLEGKSKWQFFIHFYLAHLIWNVGTTWWVYKASLGGAIFMLLANSALQIAPWALYRFSKKIAGINRSYFLLLIYYIGFEHLHQTWDLSWPWLTLGNSLGAAPAFAQFYEYTGAAGGSIWILGVGILLAIGFNGKSLKAPIIFSIAPALFSLGMFFFQTFDTSNPIKVGLVQPNYEPHNQKFEIEPRLQIDTIVQQMEELAKQGATLMILPETAIVGGIDEEYFSKDRKSLQIAAFIHRNPEVAILGGCDSYRGYDNKATSTARKSQYDENFFYDVYNSAFYIDSSGFRDLYHKAKLVPGTEIMPYPGLFAFLDEVMISLDGTPNSLGRDYKVKNFEVNPALKVAPSICYESIYSDWTSQFVRDGANFIAVMSNDGWWGQTYGYKQLLQYGQLRAIENRRWIARSGNTGISGVISPKGILKKSSTFWQRESILATIYPQTKMTSFTKMGDYLNKSIGFLCLFIIPSIFVKWFVNRSAYRNK